MQAAAVVLGTNWEGTAIFFLSAVIIIAYLAGIVIRTGGMVVDIAGIIVYSVTPLSRGDRALLEEHSAYYLRLRPLVKKEFEKRVKEFIFDKDWIGQGLGITQEMRVRIAAAAVQLTLGLDRLLLIHFSNIVVYPDAFENRLQRRMHLGEVAPGRRTIVLSWRHFEQGFADPSDGRNLGLHEMAHALWLDNKSFDAEVDFLDPKVTKQWRALAEEEAGRIREGRSRLFRDYAATDQMEFFAVAVEYFFEQPAAFREKIPELYECMKRLLRQDPAPPQ